MGGKLNTTNHFPSRLHDMLDEAEAKGHSKVVSWTQDGKAFKIHDSEKMVPILKTYFRQTKYKSLLRQLQGYNFNRVTHGINKGEVSHPLFVRGRKSETVKMKRKSPKTLKESLKSKTPVKSSSDVIIPTRIGSIKAENSISEPIPSSLRNSTSQYKTKSVIGVQPSTIKAISGFQPPTAPMTKPSQVEIQFQMGQNQERQPQQKSLSSNKDHMSIYNTAGHQHCYQQGLKQGLDAALRVEIGCTLSTSSTDSKQTNASSIKSFSLKRNASSLQQEKHHLAQGSISAPNFHTQYFKRQRNHERVERQNSQKIKFERSHHNASFPISMMQHLYRKQKQESQILEGKKMQFQNYQADQREQFREVRKMTQLPSQVPSSSSFASQPQKHQIFQQGKPFDPSVGALDLDISLTTTTTTTTFHSNGNSSVETQICKEFAFHPELEPTPFRTPHNDSTCNNITIINNSKNNVVLSNPTGKVTLGLTSGVSDDIDIGIAQAFDDEPVLNPTIAFDSVRDGEESKEVDSWTIAVENIVFGGKSDCVKEPELFQQEADSLFLNNNNNDSHCQPILQQQNQEMMLMDHKQRNIYNINDGGRNLPLPQHLSKQFPLPILSTPMPLRDNRLIHPHNI